MDELAPEDHGLDHLGPPEVQVPVFHPDVLVGEDALLLIAELEGRELGLVEQHGVGDQDLHLSGGVPGILGPLDPLPDDTVDLDAGFAGEIVHDGLEGLSVDALGERLGVEYDLCDAVSVGEIDESDSAVVPGEPYPSLKTDLFAQISGPELAAGVCSSHESAS